MSNHSERTHGTADKLGGKLKKRLGRILYDRRIEVEGRAKEFTGRARVASARGRERARGAAEQLVGAAKNRVGRVIGNERMIVEGRLEQLEGRARRKASF
jgi:uncharacterized protein YjbJ (UPF0337 family)